MRVTGIEIIDITGTGGVEIELAFLRPLTMTRSGHQFTIIGESGDQVPAGLSGHNVMVKEMGALARHVVDGGAATLNVDVYVQKKFGGNW